MPKTPAKTLHGLWLPDSYAMAFWLETASDEQADEANGEHLHPFAADFRDWRDLLPRSLDLFEEERVMLLPTLAGKPLPSTDPVPAEARLQAWALPTGESIIDCLLEYLLSSPPSHPDYAWGASLRYWRLAAQYASQLHASDRFAPGVTRLESRLYASWQAVFDDHADLGLQQILACMPPSCRAPLAAGGRTRQQTGAAELTLSFIDACIDHFLRQRILRRNPRLRARKKSSAPPHRQWFNSLKTGQLNPIDGPDGTLDDFEDRVAAWIEYLRPSRCEAPWRLGFVLQSPEDEVGPWDLRYMLVSGKNPALKIPAVNIWRGDSDVHRLLPTARETLLADLGNAIDILPTIGPSFAEGEPCGFALDRAAAAEFITCATPELRRYGFPVELPDWCEDGGTAVEAQLGIRAGGPHDRHSLLGINELVAYDWELALGGRKLTWEELEELVAAKQQIVFHGGKWTQLNPKALKRSVDFFAANGLQGQSTLANALRLGTELGADNGLVRVGVRLNNHNELLADLEAQWRRGGIEPPPEFIGSLRPYQKRGVSWLLAIKGMGLGACLADDMGLGKTVQMIAVLIHEKSAGKLEDPSLIICPMSVVGNWVKELQRFAPTLRVMVHHGSDRETRAEFIAAASRHDLVITTYALAVRDAGTFARICWENLILDEAQNIKNTATKQAIAIRSLRSRHRFCLTGTPVENRLTELWSIMNFLNPGHLGSLPFFRRNFCVPIERDRDRSRSELLQKIIRPFVLRRLKADRKIIRDLPEKLEMKVFCNLTAEQASLYQMVVNEMLSSLGSSRGIERKGLVLSALVKLKQVTNHPAHFLHDFKDFSTERSGKLQRLVEMVEEILAENDKALIFTQFTEAGEPMQRVLAERLGVEVLYLHGGTPKSKRDEMIQTFQRPQGPPIFMLSLKAGGIGLNLTAACHVFHFDRWWNPAVEDQATDRAFRIGQRRNVQVHKFVSVGTVEEKIDQMIEQKRHLADNIVSAGENMLTELSTSELREVFSLTRDAVVE